MVALMVRAVDGVRRNARQGALPSYAWTLGLSRPVYAAMLAQHDLGWTEPMSVADHDRGRTIAPADLHALAAMLYTARSLEVDANHADWLAHAIATAAFGHRHLWQDLGMAGREDVSRLLAFFFPALFARNVRDLKWKRFLFVELGASRGESDLRPPHCDGCDQFNQCFPDERESGERR